MQNNSSISLGRQILQNTSRGYWENAAIRPSLYIFFFLLLFSDGMFSVYGDQLQLQSDTVYELI